MGVCPAGQSRRDVGPHVPWFEPHRPPPHSAARGVDCLACGRSCLGTRCPRSSDPPCAYRGGLEAMRLPCAAWCLTPRGAHCAGCYHRLTGGGAAKVGCGRVGLIITSLWIEMATLIKERATRKCSHPEKAVNAL